MTAETSIWGQDWVLFGQKQGLWGQDWVSKARNGGYGANIGASRAWGQDLGLWGQNWAKIWGSGANSWGFRVKILGSEAKILVVWG